MKKIIIYILIAVLLLGSLSVLIPTGDDDNVASSGGGSSNDGSGGSSDDEGGDVPGDNPSIDDGIKPVVLISEEQMLFGTTYTSADNSITFKTYPVYSKATVSDDLKYVTSNYFGESISGSTTWGEGNYFELTFPHQESGIYSVEYTINYYGTMPISHNYVKSNGYLNVVNHDLLDVSSEGVVDFSTDVGYTLTYLVSFDFDTNYMSVKISNVTGEYDFKLYEISLLGAENTGGVLADIQYRSGFYSPDIIDSSFEKIEVINLKYCYHPEGSSIVPDEVLEDNSGTIIEGGTEAYASSDTLSFESGMSYTVGNQSITTDCVLTDYEMTQYDYMPIWPYSFTYIGPESGYYGENSWNIHLPNFESGVYVFTMDLDFQGTTSYFYPTNLNFYLKTPGLLNITNMFNIDKSKVNLAKLFGYEFSTDYGGRFKMQYVFDFDNDVITCNLVDLNGKSYSLGEQSLVAYREYYDESTGQTVNTKVKPITLRIQIAPDSFDVNPNNTTIQFLTWSYKKLLEDA